MWQSRLVWILEKGGTGGVGETCRPTKVERRHTTRGAFSSCEEGHDFELVDV